MVRADIIDAIDRILRVYSHNLREPFGGKQLLLVGDVFQLEPVVKTTNGKYWTASILHPIFFCQSIRPDRPGIHRTSERYTAKQTPFCRRPRPYPEQYSRSSRPATAEHPLRKPDEESEADMYITRHPKRHGRLDQWEETGGTPRRTDYFWRSHRRRFSRKQSAHLTRTRTETRCTNHLYQNDFDRQVGKRYHRCDCRNWWGRRNDLRHHRWWKRMWRKTGIMANISVIATTKRQKK